jgi:endonuclease I
MALNVKPTEHPQNGWDIEHSFDESAKYKYKYAVDYIRANINYPTMYENIDKFLFVDHNNPNKIVNFVNHIKNSPTWTAVNVWETSTSHGTPPPVSHSSSSSSASSDQGEESSSNYTPYENIIRIVQILNLFCSQYNGNVKCVYTGTVAKLPDEITKILKGIRFTLLAKNTKELSTALTKSEIDTIIKFSNLVNEEHIVPASVYAKFPGVVCDPHNIFPALSIINSFRANFQFAETLQTGETLCGLNETDSQGITSSSVCLLPKNSPSKTGRKVNWCITRYIPEGISVCSASKGEQGCSAMNFGKFTGKNNVTIFDEQCKKFYGNNYTGITNTLDQVACRFGNCKISTLPTARGTIARAILYFHLFYFLSNKYLGKLHPASNEFDFPNKSLIKLYYRPNDNFTFTNDHDLLMFVRWAIMYPPDYFEINKNEQIKGIFGNVNPFIVNGRLALLDLILETICDVDYLGTEKVLSELTK